MEQRFDPLQALGVTPPSHIGRFRFLSESDSSIVGTIGFGVLFVMAFWSGPARQAFTEIKKVLSNVDPEGRLKLVVIDTDGCADVYRLPEFLGKMNGAGETAWIKNGQIIRTSGLGFHPECFEPFTRLLLKESPP